MISIKSIKFKSILLIFLSFFLIGSSIGRDEFDFSKNSIKLPDLEKIKTTENKIEEPLFGTDIKNVINKKFFSSNIIQGFKRGCSPFLHSENHSGAKKVYFSLLDKGDKITEFSYKQISVVSQKGDDIKYPYSTDGTLKDNKTTLVGQIITSLTLKGNITQIKTDTVIPPIDENTKEIKRKDLLNILGYNVMRLELTENFEFKIGDKLTQNKEDIIDNGEGPIKLLKNNLIISNFAQTKSHLQKGSILYIAFKYKNGQIAIRFPSIKTFANYVDEPITRKNVILPLFIPFTSSSTYTINYSNNDPKIQLLKTIYNSERISFVASILFSLPMEAWETNTQIYKVDQVINMPDLFKFDINTLFKAVGKATFFSAIGHNNTPFFIELPNNEDVPPLTYAIANNDNDMCDTDLHFSIVDEDITKPKPENQDQDQNQDQNQTNNNKIPGGN